jgi:hypothetical protein
MIAAESNFRYRCYRNPNFQASPSPHSGRALSPLPRGRSRLGFPRRRRAVSALRVTAASVIGALPSSPFEFQLPHRTGHLRGNACASASAPKPSSTVASNSPPARTKRPFGPPRQPPSVNGPRPAWARSRVCKGPLQQHVGGAPYPLSLRPGRLRQSAQAGNSVRTGAPRERRVIRMISFSASTTKKKTRPPTNSHGHTESGIASVSKRVWNGGA